MARRCFLPWTARFTRAMGCSFRRVRNDRVGGLEAEELLHLAGVARSELGLLAEVALPLLRLLLEDVVEPGLAAQDLAGARDLEALGGALVGLHLRHRYCSWLVGASAASAEGAAAAAGSGCGAAAGA